MGWRPSADNAWENALILAAAWALGLAGLIALVNGMTWVWLAALAAGTAIVLPLLARRFSATALRLLLLWLAIVGLFALAQVGYAQLQRQSEEDGRVTATQLRTNLPTEAPTSKPTPPTDPTASKSRAKKFNALLATTRRLGGKQRKLLQGTRPLVTQVLRRNSPARAVTRLQTRTDRLENLTKRGRAVIRRTSAFLRTNLSQRPRSLPGHKANAQKVRALERQLLRRISAVPQMAENRAERAVLRRLARRLRAMPTRALLLNARRIEAVRAALAQTASPDPPPDDPADVAGETEEPWEEAIAAIKALCRDARGTTVGTVCERAEDATDARALPQVSQPRDADARGLKRKAADAKLAVARYELAAAPDDKKGDASKAVADSGTALGEATRNDEPTDIAAAVRAAVYAPWTPAARDDGGYPLAVGLSGIAVLAILALWAYRRLERQAAAGATGPVLLAGPSDEESSGDVEWFRTMLLRNVPEPGAVPGADDLQSVTDILAAVKVPMAGTIGKAIAAVVTLFHQKAGYTVAFKALSPLVPAAAADEESTADGPEKSAVAVRVMDARTERIVRQKVVSAGSKGLALRAAAYWAAAVVLERSAAVPRWSRWSGSTSEALAALYGPQDSPDAVEGDDASDVEKLTDAVKLAPTSGTLCLALSHANALEGEHFAAFSFALRAASLFPDFIAARYRVAVTASLMAADLSTNWLNRPEPEQQALLAALRRYPGSNADNLPIVLAGGLPVAIKPALCAFAITELDEVTKLLDRSQVIWKSLRRSERAYWLGLLRRRGSAASARMQMQRSIESAKPAIRARAGFPLNDEPVRTRAAKPDSFWQISYNLACCDAIRAETTGDPKCLISALELLEQALERPGSHQLIRRWLSADPDLAALAGHPRFVQLLERVHDDRSVDAVDA